MVGVAFTPSHRLVGGAADCRVLERRMNLIDLLGKLPAAMNAPFSIHWTEYSARCLLFFTLAYGIAALVVVSSRKNTRRGAEHGSAKWGDPRAVNKKYRDKTRSKTAFLPSMSAWGWTGKKHRRTLNTLVCGGSGAGKSRFYAKVNLCQANTSFFILDCKGELLRDCGGC